MRLFLCRGKLRDLLVRNSYNFVSNILRGEDEIYIPTCYCAPGHVWPSGRLKLMRDGNAPHFL